MPGWPRDSQALTETPRITQRTDRPEASRALVCQTFKSKKYPKSTPTLTFIAVKIWLN